MRHNPKYHKRFTDTLIYGHEWFRKLPPAYKQFWHYLLCRCDYIGIWQVDMDAASFFVGEHLDAATALEMLGDRVRVLSDKEWWLPGFVSFQYGRPSPEGVRHTVATALAKRGLSWDGASTETASAATPTESVLQPPKAPLSPKDVVEHFLCGYAKAYGVEHPGFTKGPRGTEVAVLSFIKTLHRRNITAEQMCAVLDWQFATNYNSSTGKPAAIPTMLHLDAFERYNHRNTTAYEERKITPAQVRRLWVRAGVAGLKREEVLAALKRIDRSTPEDLLQHEEYDLVIEWIDANKKPQKPSRESGRGHYTGRMAG